MKSSFLNMNWQLSKHLLINRTRGRNIKTNILEGAKKTRIGLLRVLYKIFHSFFSSTIQNDIYSIYF